MASTKWWRLTCFIAMHVLFDIFQLPEDEDGQRAALGELVKVDLLAVC